MAISLIVSPSYVGEMADTSIRGSLALVVELTYSSGLLMTYLVGWLADYKTLAIICSVIPVIVMVLMIPVPESPYYLMMTGESIEAYWSLKKLRSCSAEEFENEIEVIRMSILEQR